MNMTRWDLGKISALIVLILISLIALHQVSVGASPLFVLVFGVATLTCSLWLVWGGASASIDPPSEIELRRDSRSFQASLLGFFIIASALILLTWGKPGSRGLASFFLWCSLAGFAAILVFFSNSALRKWIILFIVLPFLFLEPILSQNLSYEYVVGTDPWRHMRLTNELLQGGDLSTIYHGLPILHSFFGMGTVLLGLSYGPASLLLLAVPASFLLPLVVYRIGSILFDGFVGLFSSIVLSVSHEIVRLFVISIPNSLGLLFITVILFVGISISTSKRKVLITIILMLTLVLSHSLTSLQLGLILGALALLRFIIRYDPNQAMISNYLITLFIVCSLGWWIYVTGHIRDLVEILFSDTIVGIGRERFAAPPAISEYRRSQPFLDQFLDGGAIIIFVGLSLLGILFSLSRKSYKRFSWIVVGLVPLCLGFSALVLGGSIIPARWWALAQIILSVMVAVGIIWTVDFIRGITGIQRYIGLSIGIIFLSSTMIVGTPINFDGSSPTDAFGIRAAFMNSEIEAGGWSTSYHGDAWGDDYYGELEALDFEIEKLNEGFLRGNLTGYCTGGLLIREEIRDSPIRVYGGDWKVSVDSINMIPSVCFSIYSSGTVTAWLRAK